MNFLNASFKQLIMKILCSTLVYNRHEAGVRAYQFPQHTVTLGHLDSLLCRCPSQLRGLVAHQKSQTRTWIQAGDLWHCSLVPWDMIYEILKQSYDNLRNCLRFTAFKSNLR